MMMMISQWWWVRRLIVSFVVLRVDVLVAATIIESSLESCGAGCGGHSKWNADGRPLCSRREDRTKQRNANLTHVS
jgi:hypothetical protein